MGHGPRANFTPCSRWPFPIRSSLRVYLRGVKEAVLVTSQVFTNKDSSQGKLYLVSSDLDLNRA